MNTPQAAKDSGHDYDGIREYDNPTPGWWMAILNITILISFLYVLFWHVSESGYTIQQTWEEDQRAEFARIFGSVGTLEPDRDSILRQMENDKFMIVARATFTGTCASCHGREGGGDVGVNLCDNFFKNVKQVEDIYTVISDGANNGAMPAWKNKLSQNQRVILAAYVASLRGSHPSPAKGPEGVEIPAWPKAPGADSAPKAGAP